MKPIIPFVQPLRISDIGVGNKGAILGLQEKNFLICCKNQIEDGTVKNDFSFWPEVINRTMQVSYRVVSTCFRNVSDTRNGRNKIRGLLESAPDAIG